MTQPDLHGHPLVSWLFEQAALRFSEHGPSDARGAAFYDVAGNLAEKRAPDQVLDAMVLYFESSTKEAP